MGLVKCIVYPSMYFSFLYVNGNAIARAECGMFFPLFQVHDNFQRTCTEAFLDVQVVSSKHCFFATKTMFYKVSKIITVARSRGKSSTYNSSNCVLMKGVAHTSSDCTVLTSHNILFPVSGVQLSRCTNIC